MNNLTDKILSKIKDRGLRMRPRWHFVLQTIAVAVVCVLAFGLAVLILSWLYFILHANGAWLLPGFGPRGWFTFARSFPWLPAIGGLLFIMALAFVLEKFRWVYRWPFLYVSLGVLALTIVFSLTVARTPLHQGFYRQAQKAGSGLAGAIYRGYGRPPRGEVFVGTVANPATSTFELATENGEVFFVSINERTRLPFGYSLAPDDIVMVMGDRAQNILTAFGLRKIKSDDGFFDHPRLMKGYLPLPPGSPRR